MARTKKQPESYNGFAMPLQPDTELGLAMLIAEDEEGHHEPVAVAGTINEAKEIAESDLRGRMRRLERGKDPGICPYTYKLWARGVDGSYSVGLRVRRHPEVAPLLAQGPPGSGRGGLCCFWPRFPPARVTGRVG
ncbi:MAG: hypothetical protein LAP87_31335 [Acidobacteriia bacterium]|nr:hypothetical protein [Terriglobia bacterium]